MKTNFKIVALLLVLLYSCQNSTEKKIVYKSNTLKIEQLTQNTFVHISYLETDSYGRVPCNGLIFIDNNEAVVFDTPTNNITSSELISWIRSSLNCEVKAVVINHFHIDCLGGLKEFHANNITSYASNYTIVLSKEHQKEIHKIGFQKSLVLKIGNQKVINTYFGEAHSKDNIVSYIPNEKVLFGGCAIKSMGAKKGNLNDANIDEWSNTVEKIKKRIQRFNICCSWSWKTWWKRIVRLYNFTF